MPVSRPAPDGATHLPPTLLDPANYPHPARSVVLIETHISWVLLAGDYAYKVKKPVDLGFADFSTIGRRKHFCEEEIRLNRRLAPEIYLGVVTINDSDSGPVVEGQGPILDYAVQMRRFDNQQSLDILLEQAAISEREVSAFAIELAKFHLSLPPCPATSDHGSVATLSHAIEQNFSQIAPFVLTPDNTDLVDAIAAASDEDLKTHAKLVDERKRSGWVRECHGDLHSGNIVRIGGRLVAFDCLEFNSDLRWLDIISEASFLAMDLTVRGREDLAFLLLNRYLETTMDYSGAPLIDFYRMYFCMVRAKVGAMTDIQHHEKGAVLSHTPGLEAYLTLAASLARKPRPLLLVTHGLSGSGKTWASDRLTHRIPAIRLRADLIRKSLHGLEATEDSHSGVGTGLYSESATRMTYERLAALAGKLLESGMNVVVDATCLHRWQRTLFRQCAEETHAEYRILHCTAPETVLRARIEARRDDASEANLAVLDRQLETVEPLDEDEQDLTVPVSTDSDIEEVGKRLARDNPGQ